MIETRTVLRWLVLTMAILGGVSGNTLETMDDTELEKLIQQEQYVIVLFSKSFGN